MQFFSNHFAFIVGVRRKFDGVFQYQIHLHVPKKVMTRIIIIFSWVHHIRKQPHGGKTRPEHVRNHRIPTVSPLLLYSHASIPISWTQSPCLWVPMVTLASLRRLPWLLDRSVSSFGGDCDKRAPSWAVSKGCEAKICGTWLVGLRDWRDLVLLEWSNDRDNTIFPSPHLLHPSCAPKEHHFLSKRRH